MRLDVKSILAETIWRTNNNAKMKSWETIQKANSPSSRIFHSAVLYKDSMLIFGGYDYPKINFNDVHQFNFQTLTWKFLETIGKQPIPRFGQSAIVYNDQMIIFGGKITHDNFYLSNTTSCNHYKLNLLNLKWKEVEGSGNKPLSRSNHSCIVYKNQMIIFGGNTNRDTNDLYSLDLQNEYWTRIYYKESASSPPPLRNHVAVLYKDSMFVHGGISNYSYSSHVFEFCFKNQTWKKHSTVQGPQFERAGHAAVVHNDRMIIFGGSPSKYMSDRLYGFSITHGKWVPIENSIDISCTNFGQTAVLWKDNVYLFGGTLSGDEVRLYKYTVLFTNLFDMNRKQIYTNVVFSFL